MIEPRGIRNNNPGNIRHNPANKWQGMAPKGEQRDGAFVTFTAPEWGIRALATLLIAYQDRHGLRTLRDIIGRWAPPSENNTSAYARAVSSAIRIPTTAAIDLHDYAVLRPIVEAIIRHENGVQPYPAAVIDEGLRRAGVVAPELPPPTLREKTKAVAKSPEVVGTTIVGTATVTAAGSALLDSATSLRYASEGSIVLTVLVTLLVVAGVALVAYGTLRKLRS